MMCIMNETNAQFTPQPAIKQPSGWGKLWAAFALAFLTLIIQGFALVAGLLTGSDFAGYATAELASGLAALLFALALGGKWLIVPSLQGMRETWELFKWLFIVDAVVAVIGVASVVTEGSFELAQMWGLRVIILFLMCLGVGMFEEATFRGLVFHGLLARAGATKRGIVVAVVLSSLLFGMVHIDPTSTNFADPSQLIQALFKIMQTGIFGFIAAVAVLKTKNLWPVIIIHGLNDFMLMLLSNGLMSAPLDTAYVSEGDEGVMIIGIYLLLCIAYMPSFMAAYRTLKEYPAPDRGQFYRARTYPAGQVYAPAGAYPVAQPAAAPGAMQQPVAVAYPVAAQPAIAQVAAPQPMQSPHAAEVAQQPAPAVQPAPAETATARTTYPVQMNADASAPVAEQTAEPTDGVSKN